MSREAILGNIRAALEVERAREPARRASVEARLAAAGRASRAGARATAGARSCVALFKAFLARAGRRSDRGRRGRRDPGRDRGLSASARACRCACARGADPLLAALPWERAAARASTPAPRSAGDTAGLSRAVAGVAETGTLVLASGADNPVDARASAGHAHRRRARARRSSAATRRRARSSRAELGRRRCRARSISSRGRRAPATSAARSSWARTGRGGSPSSCSRDDGADVGASAYLRLMQLCMQLVNAASHAAEPLVGDAALIVGAAAAGAAAALGRDAVDATRPDSGEQRRDNRALPRVPKSSCVRAHSFSRRLAAAARFDPLKRIPRELPLTPREFRVNGAIG